MLSCENDNPRRFAGVVIFRNVRGYVKKRDLTGSCYCLIIVCFGTASGILRVVSEGLPKPSRSRPEADMFQITQKHETGKPDIT